MTVTDEERARRMSDQRREREQSIERLALAIHEADLGERCNAKGAGRAQHIAAYIITAHRFIGDLRSGRVEDPLRNVDGSE